MNLRQRFSERIPNPGRRILDTSSTRSRSRCKGWNCSLTCCLPRSKERYLVGLAVDQAPTAGRTALYFPPGMTSESGVIVGPYTRRSFSSLNSGESRRGPSHRRNNRLRRRALPGCRTGVADVADQINFRLWRYFPRAPATTIRAGGARQRCF